MRTAPAAAALLAATLALAPPPAAANGHCRLHARDAVVAGLHAKFGERPESYGLDDRGIIVEILTAPDGSFSVLVTLPSGATCVAFAGTAWQLHPKALGPQS